MEKIEKEVKEKGKGKAASESEKFSYSSHHLLLFRFTSAFLEIKDTSKEWEIEKALKVEITLMIVLCFYHHVACGVCERGRETERERESECLCNIIYRLALRRFSLLPPADIILARIYCRRVVHELIVLQNNMWVSEMLVCLCTPNDEKKKIKRKMKNFHIKTTKCAHRLSSSFHLVCLFSSLSFSGHLPRRNEYTKNFDLNTMWNVVETIVHHNRRVRSTHISCVCDVLNWIWMWLMNRQFYSLFALLYMDVLFYICVVYCMECFSNGSRLNGNVWILYYGHVKINKFTLILGIDLRNIVRSHIIPSNPIQSMKMTNYRDYL